MRVTFLGTGTSGGVPVINCGCAVCLSKNPKNKRLRCSVMVETEQQKILIDAAPDLRQQLLTYPFARIDAVLFTHTHADHIFGLDELRRFNYLQQAPIPVYGNEATIRKLQTIFDYAFVKESWTPGRPSLVAHVVKNSVEIGGLPVIPVPLDHGRQRILGFRMGGFAYCTDVSHIPPESYRLLVNLDVLVLDALREKSHPTHFTLDEAISEAQKIQARRTYFTHISHVLDHEIHGRKLPENCAFAHDGLVLDL